MCIDYRYIYYEPLRFLAQFLVSFYSFFPSNAKMNLFTPPPQWKFSDLGTFQMTDFLQHSTQIEKLQIWEQHKILDNQHYGVVFTFSLKFFPINHDEVQLQL